MILVTLEIKLLLCIKHNAANTADTVLLISDKFLASNYFTFEGQF